MVITELVVPSRSGELDNNAQLVIPRVSVIQKLLTSSAMQGINTEALYAHALPRAPSLQTPR